MMNPGPGTGTPGSRCEASETEGHLETMSSQTQPRASNLPSCPAWPALVDVVRAAFLQGERRGSTQGFCSPHSREIIKQFFLTS